jgi:hypothetical protein
MLFGQSLALAALSPVIRYGAAALVGVALTWFASSTFYGARLSRTEAVHAAYRERVQQATLNAYIAASKAREAIAAYTSRATVIYIDRAQKISTLETKAKNEINVATLPDCRLPDGVRDSLNAIRSSAANIIDDAYRVQDAVPQTERVGRIAREPRVGIKF